MMLAFVIAEAIIGIIAVLLAAYYAAELDRLQAKHARHGAPSRTRRAPLTEQVIPTRRIGTQPWDTASFAAQPDEPAPTDEQPTDEQTRGLYFPPVYGQACEADVLAAEAAPPFPYDPNCDNCAGMPGCGSERVFYKWSAMELTMCPRCYVNVFGGEPDPSAVHSIASVLAAQDGTQMAEVYLP